MGVMTPFELSLESELNIKVQRFANEWLFKWLSFPEIISARSDGAAPTERA
jgi:hypothetical protein